MLVLSPARLPIAIWTGRHEDGQAGGGEMKSWVDCLVDGKWFGDAACLLDLLLLHHYSILFLRIKYLSKTAFCALVVGILIEVL